MFTLAARLRCWLKHLTNQLTQRDKVQHILCSFGLVAICLLVMPPLQALFLVGLIGFAKEVYDHFFGSGFCLYDMGGNAIGMAVGMMTFWVLSSYMNLFI
jgi:hypothetical protein